MNAFFSRKFSLTKATPFFIDSTLSDKISYDKLTQRWFYRQAETQIDKKAKALILMTESNKNSISRDLNFQTISTLVYIKDFSVLGNLENTSPGNARIFTYSGGYNSDFEDSTNYITVNMIGSEHSEEAEISLEKIDSATGGTGEANGAENVQILESEFAKLKEFGAFDAEIKLLTNDSRDWAYIAYSGTDETGEQHDSPAYEDFKKAVEHYINNTQISFLCDNNKLCFEGANNSCKVAFIY